MAGKVQTAARPSGQAKRPAMNQDIREQQMPKKKKKVKHFYDYSLLFCIIFLTAFGLVMIYSASSYSAQLNYKGNGAYFMERQAGIAAVGFVAMIIISKMDYQIFARFSVLAYLMSYILMIAVSFVGREVNGKRRWLAIGPLSFQPTEFVKIALIVMLVAMITTMGIKINKWRNMGYVVAMTLPIAGLVAMNNLSSGIIVCGIAFVMLFVACKVKWPFFTIGALGLGTLAFAGPIGKFLMTIKLLQPYQFRRIEAWLNPESDPTDKGFQVLQGLYAIGSGGLVGQGLGESIQKLGFLPESQNDMIFAIICEELGLFGAVSIILIFLFMIYRFMLIANNAPDLFGALLVVGVMGHIAIQVILNIAVVTNTIPNTGITLPFISYGGTSVLFLLMEMGVVLSVSNQIKLEK
ncbi:MAG: FtsW/RodA/SpoVE family cell cycle protein [Clostridium sp.]|nr:FtsW/RodA/SpoVE family cell cycle protein [Clostridium sp.]